MSMSDVEALNRLVEDSAELNNMVLSVIDPPFESKDREDYVEADSKDLPPSLPWRHEGCAGKYLDGRLFDVRANFFGIESSRVPRVIYLHDVKIFRYMIVDEKQVLSEQGISSPPPPPPSFTLDLLSRSVPREGHRLQLCVDKLPDRRAEMALPH